MPFASSKKTELAHSHENYPSPHLSILATSIAALVAAAPQVQAQVTWDGGGADDLWGSGLNWVGDVSPSPSTTTDIAFDGAVRLTPVSNYGAFDDFRNVLFNVGASSFTVSGNAIDLFGKIENNSANTQTFNLAIGTGSVSGGFIEIDPTAGDLNIGGTDVFLNNNQLRVWGNNGKPLTFGASTIISGTSGTLAINQNSNVVFQSAHTYTGATTVKAGALIVNGSISGSAVTVDGATSVLGGSGSTGSVLVQNGGTIAPGNSPGLLNLGALTMSAGTALRLEMNTTTPATGYDQLSVTGGVTLGGSYPHHSEHHKRPVLRPAQRRQRPNRRHIFRHRRRLPRLRAKRAGLPHQLLCGCRRQHFHWRQ